MTLEHPQLRSTVVVVGGGIAGLWTAYKLMNRGISTIVVAYSDRDRGGTQGSTSRSVGAINTTVVKRPDYESYMTELGLSQTHPFAISAIKLYVHEEVEAFAAVFALKPVKIGVALASESGAICMQTLQERFVALGGRMINGWITRIVAGEGHCRGVQYQQDDIAGSILCHSIVLASGGYSGLYPSAMNTHSYGILLGRYLACGGRATNLEFLFRHGYGNIDTNDVTPTEEIAGAEIYNGDRKRELDLERLLFEGQGTATHLQANQLWLRAKEGDYTIDLSHRPLFEAFKKLIANPSGDGLQSFLALFPVENQPQVRQLLEPVLEQGGEPDATFATFQALKPLRPVEAPRAFRVKPLTYFCMGGAAHVACRTNLRDVYATGEFMHDFGANRVGGLPWALYLSAGRAISEQIAASLSRFSSQPFVEFPVERTDSQFKAQIITFIRRELAEYQERNFSEERATACLERFRQTRQALRSKDVDHISDAACSLLVGEAIIQSSINRRESRGYFFREDFSLQDDALNDQMSCVWYDQREDMVQAKLVHGSSFVAASNEPCPGEMDCESRVSGSLASCAP
jgi:fatty acid CoA ligase FadD22